MIDHRTQLNLVIGHPLSHTKSPLLHTLLYRELNCNAVMLAHAGLNLESVLQACMTLSVQLIAVTMPFKKEIIAYLDEMTPEVKQLQSANTVIVRNQKRYGYNTDVDGIAYALRNVTLENKNVLVIGAGGAAEALAYFLEKQNAHLFFLNRTKKHADQLIQKYGGQLYSSDVMMDVVVNTTPVGMFPNIDESPISHAIFQEKQVVFDMVYNPVETLFLKQAKEKGAECISGLDMFVAQGIRQVELWMELISKCEHME